MNERIQQLAIEATEYVDVPMPNEIYNLGEGVFRKISTFNREKFTELIVRECLEIVDEEGCGEGGSVRACIKIKEHFGVSE